MTRLAQPRWQLAIIALVFAVACVLPKVRHRVLHAARSYDAHPGDGVTLPRGTGAGLPPADRVRVVLIDGLSADTAATMPASSALCDRGLRLVVDVGFPTVSLPVESALWTGLTQQQSGIVSRTDLPIIPPLAGIPSQVPGSSAIAESHGYIVRSLGFARAQPPADEHDAALDAADATWRERFPREALAAIAEPARLVFVHVLRVDDAGHAAGHDSHEYAQAAREADALLGDLLRAAPDARWFVLSDHGHLPGGGHGGEEKRVRQVEGCIAGPGIAPRRGGPVDIVDVARALADSLGVTLDLRSPGRPLEAALAAPLTGSQALPGVPLGRALLALAWLVVGIAATLAAVGRSWWLGPWWFVIALVALVAVRGEPTLSMAMIVRADGRAMYLTWLPALPLAAAATWFGLGRTTLRRVLAGQLALPGAAVAAAISACGAWPVVAGVEVAPVVPRYTAWLSVLLLACAHGALAVSLAALARFVRAVVGRRGTG